MNKYLSELSEFIDNIEDIAIDNARDGLEYYQEEELKPITPVDTGELKGSYNKVKRDGKTIIISNEAEHSERILWWASSVFGKGQYSQSLPDGMRPSLISFINKEGGYLK